MIVPPGIAAMICVWVALSDRTERSETNFDWTGFLALSVAISAAQLIMDRGQRLDWFESMEIKIELGIAIVALWIFIVHSLTAARPFLDPRLLLDRNFSIGLMVSFVMGMLSFTPMVLFPILLHDLRGYPDSLVGMLLAARGIGTKVKHRREQACSEQDPKNVNPQQTDWRHAPIHRQPGPPRQGNFECSRRPKCRTHPGAGLDGNP
jgi:DHA2 family multidrug resistance protein